MQIRLERAQISCWGVYRGVCCLSGGDQLHP
jgi:hypothetical protein